MNEPAPILIVDDQPRNLDAVEAILQSPELTLVRAQSAEEALLAVLRHDFAAIVLDIRMPGVSGIELADLIKKRKRTQHVPVLFLTAHLMDEHEVLRGYGVGAVDYLTKPINPQILRSKVAVFVDLYRKNRALLDANRALQTEISERLRVQEELRRVNDHLETMVRDRTSDLTVANAALRESEERLRLAIAAAHLLPWEMDLSNERISFASEAPETFGFAPGSWDGPLEDAARVVHPEDRQAALSAFRGIVNSSESEYAAEFRIVRPQQGVAWVINRGRIIRDAEGRPVRALGVLMDITRRKQFEEELQRHNELLDAAVAQRTRELRESLERLHNSERLATVGTLAAGLGHDMSNLLLPIRARLGSLAELDLPASAADDVASIREAAAYLQRLASGLRLLAADPDRAQEGQSGIDLANWWRDVEGVFRAGLPRGVRLEGRIAPDLPRVSIATSRLTQAVFNLVQNAGEAVTSGHTTTPGVIKVSSSLATEDGRPFVQLMISDNGPGMTPEIAARCFEPYFSTKTRVVSTGMGLPMVRAWVEAAGGRVDLRTAPGSGVTFTLSLRTTGETPAHTPPRARLRAAVSLDDARAEGLVKSMLTARGAGVFNCEEGRVPDAEMWILGGASATPERVIAFLAEHPRRQAIVLESAASAPERPTGSRASPEWPLPEPGLLGGRVQYLGRRPTFTAIRGALLKAVENAESPAGDPASEIDGLQKDQDPGQSTLGPPHPGTIHTVPPEQPSPYAATN
ncbi:MAG: response regulator [Phycisphaerales bacterium]|nr:response regulator [Phycisphaerales bacterium]